MALVERVKAEEMAAVREKFRMEREQHRQELDIKDDKLQHVEDLLLKSDERMGDKINVIKADYTRLVRKLNFGTPFWSERLLFWLLFLLTNWAP